MKQLANNLRQNQVYLLAILQGRLVQRADTRQLGQRQVLPSRRLLEASQAEEKAQGEEGQVKGEREN